MATFSPAPPPASRTVAVMQPYLFPYLGYFALAAAADVFVFYDDVGFIRNGWINRNRWLLDGRVGYFTAPVSDAASSHRIRDVQIAQDRPWRRKLLASLHQHYRRAPHFAAVAPLVEAVFVAQSAGSVAALAKASVEACARYLGLATAFVDSSAAYGNAELRGAARVIDICRRERASAYLNLPAGRALYDAAEFQRRGIELRFVVPPALAYRQGAAGFVADLSIIDVLMHNDVAAVREALGCVP